MSWRPDLSYSSTIFAFLFFGIVYLIMGVVLYCYSDKINEISVKYNAEAYCGSTNWAITDKTCAITLDIKAKMKQPVFMYYELDKFYQNNRRYVASRDDKQLRGEKRTYSEIHD
jgi:hypothetical protein